MRVPSYTTTAVPPLRINLDDIRSFDDYIQRAEMIERVDTGIPPVGDLQAQISLLNKRIETLEELLLEFGIKKVFDETDNKE